MISVATRGLVLVHNHGESPNLSGSPGENAAELRARAGDAEEDDRQPATIITMPTVLRIGPYRCFFFAGDRPEPAHVHVERDANRAKVWLDPVRLQDSGGFPRGELARIILMVRQHEVALLRSWNDYFAD